MKGAVFFVLCTIALAQAAVLVNENGCPVDYTVEKLLPSSNCSLYYQCVHGNLMERHCSPGLHFNSELNECDFPASAKCEDSPSNSEKLGVNVAEIKKVGEDSPVSVHDDPSQAPSICADPDSNGVLVAHEYCNYFYICSFGGPVSIKCPSELLYDPTYERCEWAKNVDCGKRVIAESEEVTDETSEDNSTVNDDPSQAAALCAVDGSDNSYVAHEICNKFYQCWAGEPVPLPCPVGTLWNPKKNYCDFPENVDCGDRIIADNNNSDKDNDALSEDDVNADDDEDTPVGNNHDDPSEAAKICSSPDSSGVLVAHENCNQFYKCTFGSPVALLCPSGLLFDPTKDRCEWADTVNCGERIIPDKNEESEEKVTESGGIGNVNDDPNQASAICAAEGSDHHYVAHEICNKFYQCWAGKPVPLPCPIGTLWNPEKNYCDFPQNVDCGDRIIVDNDNSDKDDNVVSEDDVNDDIPVGNNHDNPNEAAKICSTSDSSGVLVAHENCNQFYKCTFGNPVALLCPAGLLFDPTRDRCEWADTVNCGERIIPDKDDESEEKVTESSDNGNVNDDPSQASAICAAEGSDHQYVAHEICNQFYQCWAGKPVPLPCPADTLWNPSKEYCDFPYNVDCGDRLAPTTLLQ